MKSVFALVPVLTGQSLMYPLAVFTKEQDALDSQKMFNDWETQYIELEIRDTKLTHNECVDMLSSFEFLSLKKRFDYTPEYINEIMDNEIFVFGSNLSGIHGAGAAKIAVDNFGAVYGKGIGMYGNSYAIPTKDENVMTLPLSKIEVYVNDFIKFAEQNPKYNFIVTKIGCGLAGFLVRNIAPLFKDALDMKNIILPKEFVDFNRKTN